LAKRNIARMPLVSASPTFSPLSAAGDGALDAVSEHLDTIAVHLLRELRRAEVASLVRGPGLAALMVLCARGTMTMGELADAEHVSASTMTRLVQGLERHELAMRHHHSHDRRSVLVSATRRGRALLRAGRGRRIAELARRLEGVAPEDLAALARATLLLKDLLCRP
jgi:DNA-binding MarR family transcriptional regulator